MKDFFKRFENINEMVSYLDNLVGDVVPVAGIPDLHRAFDSDIHRSFGKTVIEWNK